MTTLGKIVTVIVLALVVIGGWLYWTMAHPAAPASTTGTATTTEPVVSQAQTVTTPAGLTFSYAEPYGLATTAEQITVKSYIPSCMSGFDYCIYRTGDQYAKTNFESAGVAVKLRSDLKTQTTCLTAPPSGYTRMHATSTEANGYSVSISGPLGEGATGHYTNGYQYRLWHGTTCYEFNTQIGETQFANYPAGTKTEFSAADRASVMQELYGILSSVMVNGTKVVFPKS